MSVVYNKSRSNKFVNYFSSEEELLAKLNWFLIEENMISINPAQKKKPWESGKAGIPLVCSGNKVAIDHSDSHTLVVGPTGSKKSRLVIMPQVRILGCAGESMIISDPKAEIYNRTAAFLKNKGYNIMVLNLRAPMHGIQWNPLEIPYRFYCEGDIDKACEFTNDIAENLINTNKSDKDPFWDNSAGSLFFGLAMLLFKFCKDYEKGDSYIHIANIIKLRNDLFSGGSGGRNSELWKYAKEDQIIRSSLIGTVETANETKASILSVFDQKMRMFTIQPNLVDMLGASQIDFDGIAYSPTAVFLILPDEKTGYHGLVSLFIKQSYEYMIFKAQSVEDRDGLHVGLLKNRVNYILDEFSSLPTINDFPAMITAARSRNIRFTLVIQSKHQLSQRYGDEAETIKTNCNNWLFMTSRELNFLEEISTLCGNVTGENREPVLSVSLLQRMDKEEGEVLLLCGRMKPCIARLADISTYDGDAFERLPIAMRDKKPPSELDFIIPQRNDGSIKNNINLNVDELVARIDKKIAELEAEEAAERNKAPESSENKE